MKTQRGKLIVIDGTDGSGKATQTARLIERMRAAGHRVETMSFPRYGTPYCIPVEEYLGDRLEPAAEIGPRAASVYYAVDRFAASGEIRAWLDAGTHVVLDRYVASNMGHQGSKMSDPDERAEFFRWNDELEHERFGIPRPDLNVVLHVPAEVSVRLIEERGETKDAHESDVDHLRAAERTYVEIAGSYPGFALVECAPDGELLSRERIEELVWERVTPLLATDRQTA